MLTKYIHCSFVSKYIAIMSSLINVWKYFVVRLFPTNFQYRTTITFLKVVASIKLDINLNLLYQIIRLFKTTDLYQKRKMSYWLQIRLAKSFCWSYLKNSCLYFTNERNPINIKTLLMLHFYWEQNLLTSQMSF